MAGKGEWTEAKLDPLKIALDANNPRIEVGAKATQDVIREELLAQEEIVELARDIVKSDGMLYGDRIITVLEAGKHLVLEGNRRVAACQLLLEPALIPTKFKARFPVAGAALKSRLRSIPADVSPNREAAEPILTKRHTERGIKPWSPMAKMRRAARWVASGLSFEDAAARLGTTSAQVKRLVRPYRLLQYALGVAAWSPAELQALEGENLITTPYTRFFTLSRTREILGLSFDEQENPKSSLPARVFKKQMTNIVRDFLLPDPIKKKPREDTRTDPDTYFKAFLSTPAGVQADARAKAAAAKKTKKSVPRSAAPHTPKASIFFEKLQCKINDDNLIKLTVEIVQVKHDKMPIAASMLFRAVLECALRYKIKQAKKWGDVVAKSGGKDPELGMLLNFAADRKNAVFAELRICDVLGSQQTREAKNYLDTIVHNHWRQADPSQLVSFANNLRNVISYILEGN